MPESRKVLEFDISREILVNALAHVSYVAPMAAIALIKFNEETIGGININTVANGSDNGHQFDTYASFAIFNDEMGDTQYNVDNAHPWPVVYIACTPDFITAISKLKPKHGDCFAVQVWNIIDGDKIKSEITIYGEHNSNIGSIIEHSDMRIKSGKIVPSSANSLNMDAQRHYV